MNSSNIQIDLSERTTLLSEGSSRSSSGSFTSLIFGSRYSSYGSFQACRQALSSLWKKNKVIFFTSPSGKYLLRNGIDLFFLILSMNSQDCITKKLNLKKKKKKRLTAQQKS